MTHWQTGMRLTPARLGEEEEGEVSLSFSAATQQTATVTFSQPFASTPRVVAQVVSPSGSAVKSTVLVTAVSTTSFSIRVDLTAAATLSVTVHWHAKR